MLTYVSGVPLGTEGPSVQMGTSIGKGTTEILARKNRAWERYIMTGGASAGFAVATSAPLTGIIFALEEVHRRFSPTVFMAAAVSVLSAMTTQSALSSATGINVDLFSFTITKTLPLKHLWATVVIGIICGICGLLFTKFYKFVRTFREKNLKRINYYLKVVIIFITVAAVGFFSDDLIGSGHALTEKIFHGEFIWYLLILAFIIRAVLMIFANTEGVTGGTFLPILTFGAIVGGLIGKIMISAGLIEDEYFQILVTVGMATFLAVTTRTPITAIAFAAEALCGVYNIIPVAIGVIIGYVIIEASGIKSFTDAIMEAKIEKENEGKRAFVVDTHMRVEDGAFAIGKEIRDILWPPTCTVLSVDRHNTLYPTVSSGLAVGDLLHLHYKTYDIERSLTELEYILGEQKERDNNEKMHDAGIMHIVPES
jgi:H+/Cl- antiporter ClcA